ncbi:hypothetical protein MNBD_GAMMA08-2957 [hydrothermal vent metagenome]|uniref:Uncharacterized protein n=1 Tax=hydrothermal vent metagenome TaxID=652676 RepID=A0A3B0X391_9ZZZZ
MNICHRFLLVIIVSILQLGNAQSFENSSPIALDLEKLCDKAMFGKLNLSYVKKLPSTSVSYLFDCAITIVVHMPDEDPKSIQIQNLNKRKIEIADALLSLGIDTGYKDETGSNLLISVIVSYIPEKWKIKFIKILVSKGCSIKENNKYGKSAFELAKNRNEIKIIEALTGKLAEAPL